MPSKFFYRLAAQANKPEECKPSPILQINFPEVGEDTLLKVAQQAIEQQYFDELASKVTTEIYGRVSKVTKGRVGRNGYAPEYEWIQNRELVLRVLKALHKINSEEIK